MNRTIEGKLILSMLLLRVDGIFEKESSVAYVSLSVAELAIVSGLNF